MINEVELHFSKISDEALGEIESRISTIEKDSSRKYVRSSITKVYKIVEKYSSFLVEKEFYTKLQSLVSNLYSKLDIQYFLPRLYSLSLLTSSEEKLKNEILALLASGEFSWLDDEVNLDYTCRIFATEPVNLLEFLLSVSLPNTNFFAIAFRLSENLDQFSRYCDVLGEGIGAEFNSVVCREICRNPCRYEYLKSTNFHSHFIDYLENHLDEEGVIEAILLIHHYSEKHDSTVLHLFSEELVNSIFKLSSKRHRILFLKIRRLPSKKITDIFKSKIKIELSEQHQLSTKLLILKLLSGSLDINERIEIHSDFVLKVGMKNFPILASAASILELSEAALSLVRASIATKSVRDWIPKGSYKSVKELFEIANKFLAPEERSLISKPLVSAIITTFNPDTELLRLAINSLLNQRGINIQIIIVDDCSHKEKLRDIENLISSLEDPNNSIVFVKREVNAGQYVCRNIAMSFADGDYICIQDDDDISHPERLVTQISEMHKNPGAMLCYTKHLRIKENLAPCIDDRQGLTILGDGPASLLFRKELIQDIGGFRAFRSRGDIEFRERAISYYGKGSVAYVDSPMYMMRSSLSSVSSIYEYQFSDKLQYYRDIIDINAESKNVVAPWENCHG